MLDFEIIQFKLYTAKQKNYRIEVKSFFIKLQWRVTENLIILLKSNYF